MLGTCRLCATHMSLPCALDGERHLPLLRIDPADSLRIGDSPRLSRGPSILMMICYQTLLVRKERAMSPCNSAA
jgi:hypothetical protein